MFDSEEILLKMVAFKQHPSCLTVCKRNEEEDNREKDRKKI